MSGHKGEGACHSCDVSGSLLDETCGRLSGSKYGGLMSAGHALRLEAGVQSLGTARDKAYIAS